jgi:hypothetical protein
VLDVGVVALALLDADRSANVLPDLLMMTKYFGFSCLHTTGWTGHLDVTCALMRAAREAHVLHDLLLLYSDEYKTCMLGMVMSLMNGHVEVLGELCRQQKQWGCINCCCIL